MTDAAETITKLVAQAQGAETIATAGGREFLVLPDGFEESEVTDPYGMKPKPIHIDASVCLQAKDSLVDYVNRFKQAETVLFADIDRNSIKALIDYHGHSDSSLPGEADRVKHVASMTLPYSEEWKTWTSIDGLLLPQLKFARFIEENAPDIRVPSAGDLFDAVRDLQAKRRVNWSRAVRTETNAESFEYQEETTATTKDGSIELPTKFVLQLPVYFGEPTTELHAFLRWDFEDEQLMLGVQLHRLEHVRQAVFKTIVMDAVRGTDCPVFYGRLDF